MRFGTVTILALGCATLSACNQSSDIIGSYIGGDSSVRMMLQINSKDGHDIRGKLIAVTLDDDGKVRAVDRPLQGTVDSKLVNLNIENGSGISLLTGTRIEQGLELTVFAGDKSQKLTFERSDPDKFSELVDGVRKQAAQIKRASAQEAARRVKLRRISEAKNRINAFVSETKHKTDRMVDGTGKIKSITAAYDRTRKQADRLGVMRTKLVAENGADDFRVDQVALRRERNANQAKFYHEWVRDAVSSLNGNAVRREQRSASILADCKESSELDCSEIVSAMQDYRVRASSFRAAASRENIAFKNNRTKF